MKRYLDGSESGKTNTKSSIEVTPSLLREWIRRCKSSGENVFEKCYTSYSIQHKLDVLNYMNEQGTSIRETAALFNIPSYEIGGLDALHSKKKGRPTIKIKNKTSSRRLIRSTTSGK